MFSIFSVTLQCMFYFPCNDKNPGSGVGVAPMCLPLWLFSLLVDALKLTSVLPQTLALQQERLKLQLISSV